MFLLFVKKKLSEDLWLQIKIHNYCYFHSEIGKIFICVLSVVFLLGFDQSIKMKIKMVCVNVLEHLKVNV